MACQQLSSRHVIERWASLLLEAHPTDSTGVSDDAARQGSAAVRLGHNVALEPSLYVVALIASCNQNPGVSQKSNDQLSIN